MSTSFPFGYNFPPVPMSLQCPYCGAAHVDVGEWATKSHKTHQCQSCQSEWRPFEYPTIGVLDPLKQLLAWAKEVKVVT